MFCVLVRDFPRARRWNSWSWTWLNVVKYKIAVHWHTFPPTPRWNCQRAGSLGLAAGFPGYARDCLSLLRVKEKSVSGLTGYARNWQKNVRSTLCLDRRLDRHGGNTPFEAWQAFGAPYKARSSQPVEEKAVSGLPGCYAHDCLSPLPVKENAV